MMGVDFFHKEFRDTRAGFPDLLRYGSTLRPGLVLGKGGELIATFQYRGPDMQCASEAELNLLRVRVAGMMRRLSAGWMLHTTTLRKESLSYSDEGFFPDPVTAAIEAERRAQYRSEGTHYENDYFLTFTYLPDPILVGKVKEFAYESTDKDRMRPERIGAKSIEYFERQLIEYVGILESSLSNKLVRLMPRKITDTSTRRGVWLDDQLAFFHECITGVSQPIRLPASTVATGIDYVIGSYGFATGIRPIIDNRYIRVVAIESLPDEGTLFGALEILNRLGVQFRWTTRWIARDPEKAKGAIKKVRSKWRQKIRGLVADMTGKQHGPVNQDAVKMAADAEIVLQDLESGDVAYGHWTSTVILTDTDASYLEATVQYLMKNIKAAGFAVRDEDVNCVEAYLGSLPGHGYENVRKPECHSMNLADCLPLTSTWQGPVENPCSFYQKIYGRKKVPPLLYGAASGGTPFRVVLHNGDLGHTLVIGPPGAGKSTLLALMAASHFRYPNARFYGFEKGESMLALCLAAGGSHYNFLDDSSEESMSIGFAPFSRVDRLNDRIWAADYIETIMMLHDVKVDLDTSAEIRRAIDLLATRPAHMRSLTDLIQLIQVREVQQVLTMYEKQFAGGMLNATKDTITTSRFTVFEMEQLMEMDDKHVVPVLLYLFRMIERNLDGSPTIICLDEAWLMLRHPMFEGKLKEWFKVLRKANAMVLFATQELQDVANSPIASTIFSSCQTKILLPNPDAQMEDSMRLYKAIGCSERVIELLVGATKKRDYFFMSPAGQRMFQLELGPVALAFCATSGIDDRKMVKELYRRHGPKWSIYWLQSLGLDPVAVLGDKVRYAEAA